MTLCAYDLHYATARFYSQCHACRQLKSHANSFMWSLLLSFLNIVGTVQGGTQLQSFVSVGRRTFASNNTLRLDHKTVVYITVVAINAAGLRTVSYSDPIMIDLTKPECKFVNDGHILGKKD